MDEFVLEDEDFECYHFSDLDESCLKKFSIHSPTGQGLLLYLKNMAKDEEKNHFSRVYIIIKKTTKEVVAYFALRAGFVSVPIEGTTKFDSYPGIELEAIAVNDTFRQKYSEIRGIGKMIFVDFVVPLARLAAKIIGVHTLYIFAIPEEKLIRHYESWGFVRMKEDNEDFVHQHIKPKFDDDCIFMYQTLF